MVFAGGDNHNDIERYGDRTHQVHFKDIWGSVLADVKARDRSFLNASLDGVFTVPGDWVIPFQELLDQLEKIGYAGWIAVEAEQDPLLAPPPEYVNKGSNT